MGYISPTSSLLAILFWAVVIGFPISKILQQAGYTRWFTILAFIPLVNIVFLWIFAFQKWPLTRKPDGDVF